MKNGPPAKRRHDPDRNFRRGKDVLANVSASIRNMPPTNAEAGSSSR